MIEEKKPDIYKRKWITENSLKELEKYSSGITVRQLYYRLVALGMTNGIRYYKRVVGAMTAARWDGIVDMDAFIDRERDVYGSTEYEEKDVDTEIENAKSQIQSWMNYYSLNRWSNQPNYVEVWIEKKALQGVFERPCSNHDVGLAPCKGYPSITFLNEARERFSEAEYSGKNLIILYFGDYDPSGADIPRSVEDNLARMGIVVNMKHIALNAQQIEDMQLPGVPPKPGDSRTKNWDGGDVVECDAIEPKMLANMCENAIMNEFDNDLYDDLLEEEELQTEEYRKQLKEFVEEL